jgi:hypothetical protein
MKIMKYLSLVLVLAIAVSCEKNEITFDTTPATDMAEFQLHYFVPVTSGAANNITKVEINGQLFANNKAPLGTYNAIPSGGVGRFYTVNPGNVNIKMYQGTDMATLVYDQNVSLTKGKQNVFVHDFNLPPVVFDNEFPFISNVTAHTDSTTWVKFYNFLYETSGVPTGLKLQYQYIDPRDATKLINIGQPVSFGETTGWQPVKIVKSIEISSGYARVDYRIKVIDNSGAVVGDLQVMKTNGTYASYADYWTGYIGRRAHHTMSGMRAAAPVSAVRLFYAL